MDKQVVGFAVALNLILGIACGVFAGNEVHTGFAQVEESIPTISGLEACALAHPEPFNHNIRIAEDLGASEEEIQGAIEYVYEEAIKEGICK